MRISVITQPYNTQGKNRGGGAGPGALLASDLTGALRAQGHVISSVASVELTADEERAYGDWRRVAVANGHLGDLVAAARGDGDFVLGLYADCNSALGCLGGLARSGQPHWPLRVGLIWIDAHADYNTPETSLSGMLGGMPAAVACGKCLTAYRERSGLRVPLQQPDIAMVGLRDVDDDERAALAADGIVTLTETDMVEDTERMRTVMEAMSRREDVLYVHVDLDILEPDLAPAAGLPSAGGISGRELGIGLRHLLAYPKVGALALVSYKVDRDHDGRTLAQVREAILGALSGVDRP